MTPRQAERCATAFLACLGCTALVAVGVIVYAVARAVLR